MTFDLAAHLGAMTRVVHALERDGRPAKMIVATRAYDTDPADLWDALTRPDRLSRWFLPVTGTLALGGRYQFQGNAGGTITACDPPNTIEATWELGNDVSWLTLRLTPEQASTRLTLEHVAHVPPEMWDRFGPGAVGVGWELGLMGLVRHLAQGPDSGFTPEAAAAWLVSPEALHAYRLTSDAWCLASIAAGTPEAQARAAAERTRAFYSGEPPAVM